MSAMGARCCFTILVLLASLPATPQTIDEIVSRHLAARGGREALAAVRTLRMSGRASAGPGRVAIVRREIARPGRIRTEFLFQGTTGVYAWDGSVGWRVSPFDGRLDAEPLPADEAAAAAEQADIDGPLVDWKAKGHEVTLMGTEPLPGGPAHRLKVTLKSGAVRDFWLDARTGFVVRTQASRTVRGHLVQVDVAFGDYRETGGVSFPRSIDASVPGRPQRLHIDVDSVEVNPALGEGRFRMPS